MKHFLKGSFIILTTLTLGYAETCQYSIDNAKTKVGFEAFKTMKKLGVKVGFDKVEINSSIASAENIQDIIKSSEFSIDTGSLNSANPARDEKLKNLFFKDGKNVININGKVSDVKEDIIFVDIKIGNTTKNIPLRFSFNNNNIEAKGTIDLFDFSLNKSLANINNACKDLHEGKTWNDVNIYINATFNKNCK